MQVHDRTGNIVREIRRPYERPPVTDRDKDEYANYLATGPASAIEGAPDPRVALKRMAENTRRNGRFAERMPAYSNLIVDDDENVWIEHYRFWQTVGELPRRGSTWSVFDHTGQFLGEVKMPEAFLARTITRDRVMGFWLDEDGQQHVHIYMLQRGAAAR